VVLAVGRSIVTGTLGKPVQSPTGVDALLSVTSVLKQFVPVRARPWIRRQWTRVAHFGWKRQCPVCGGRLARFAPHGDPVEFEAVCPLCGSKAPHRLAYLFFRARRHLFERGKQFLHVAPERELGRRLSEWCRAAGMGYRRGDVTGQGAEHLDLRNTGLPSGSVDLMYCCHVFNMIDDDRTALRETCRILHPAGLAVLQVPAFCTAATTVEASTPGERLTRFRDERMFRCYTEADFVARLEAAGFTVETFRATDCPPEQIERHQLKSELLHVCRKAV
jgi:SAM-dependent methyltransferase